MKTCPSCDKEITGRIDKIFCSSYCKSSHHYLANRDKENGLYKKIDTQLKRNRKLLKEFNRAGKSTVRKGLLLDAGFDPKYFTHYWKNPKGQVYLFCYEYGYLQTAEHQIEKYVLVQWQSYMG